MADDSYVWELLPYCCSLIQPCEIMEELKQAVADGRIMSALFDNEFFESRQSMTVEEAFEDLGHYSSFQMITEEDVLELESWVGSTSSDEDEDDDDEDDDGEDDDEDEDDDDDEDNEDDDEDGDEDDDGFDEDAERADYMDYEPQAPVMRLDFTGRNQPCPCGSGKKYKKCCLGK
jgi:preprotein translocase subunit SecA